VITLGDIAVGSTLLVIDFLIDHAFVPPLDVLNWKSDIPTWSNMSPNWKKPVLPGDPASDDGSRSKFVLA